VEVLVVYIL